MLRTFWVALFLFLYSLLFSLAFSSYSCSDGNVRCVASGHYGDIFTAYDNCGTAEPCIIMISDNFSPYTETFTINTNGSNSYETPGEILPFPGHDVVWTYAGAHPVIFEEFAINWWIHGGPNGNGTLTITGTNGGDHAIEIVNSRAIHVGPDILLGSGPNSGTEGVHITGSDGILVEGIRCIVGETRWMSRLVSIYSLAPEPSAYASHRVIVRDNFFRDNNGWTVYIAYGGGAVLVERNHFEPGGVRCIRISNSGGHIIRNNVMVGPSQFFIGITSSTSCCPVHDIQILHNTFVSINQPSVAAIYVSGSDHLNNLRNLTVKNNVFLGPVGSLLPGEELVIFHTNCHADRCGNDPFSTWGCNVISEDLNVFPPLTNWTDTSAQCPDSGTGKTIPMFAYGDAPDPHYRTFLDYPGEVGLVEDDITGAPRRNFTMGAIDYIETTPCTEGPWETQFTFCVSPAFGHLPTIGAAFTSCTEAGVDPCLIYLSETLSPYVENINSNRPGSKSSTFSAPGQYAPFEGHNVIVEGSFWFGGNAGYWHLHGGDPSKGSSLTIRPQGSNGNLVYITSLSSAGITIGPNVVMRATQSGATGVRIMSGNVWDGVLIHGVEFLNDGGNFRRHIWAEDTYGEPAFYSHRLVVRDCRFVGDPQNGVIQISTMESFLLENNYFELTRPGGIGIYVDGANDILIRNNVMRDTSGGLSRFFYFDGNNGKICDVAIVHNTMLCSTTPSSGILLMMGRNNPTQDPVNTTFGNNLLLGPCAGALQSQAILRHAGTCGVACGFDPDSHMFCNRAQEGGFMTQVGFLWEDDNAACAPFSGAVDKVGILPVTMTDPKPDPYFYPTAYMAGHVSAVVADLVPTDYRGTPRTQHTIGAFENTATPKPATCGPYIATDQDACNARGECVANEVCECDDPFDWGGDECEVPRCAGIRWNATDVCNSVGECYPSNHSCGCDTGDRYTGYGCSVDPLLPAVGTTGYFWRDWFVSGGLCGAAERLYRDYVPLGTCLRRRRNRFVQSFTGGGAMFDVAGSNCSSAVGKGLSWQTYSESEECSTVSFNSSYSTGVSCLSYLNPPDGWDESEATHVMYGCFEEGGELALVDSSSDVFQGNRWWAYPSASPSRKYEYRDPKLCYPLGGVFNSSDYDLDTAYGMYSCRRNPDKSKSYFLRLFDGRTHDGRDPCDSRNYLGTRVYDGTSPASEFDGAKCWTQKRVQRYDGAKTVYGREKFEFAVRYRIRRRTLKIWKKCKHQKVVWKEVYPVDHCYASVERPGMGEMMTKNVTGNSLIRLRWENCSISSSEDPIEVAELDLGGDTCAELSDSSEWVVRWNLTDSPSEEDVQIPQFPDCETAESVSEECGGDHTLLLRSTPFASVPPRSCHMLLKGTSPDLIETSCVGSCFRGKLSGWNYQENPICFGRREDLEVDQCIETYSEDTHQPRAVSFACYRYTCFGILSTDPTVCSGRGKCTGENVCYCNAGYFGEECQDGVGLQLSPGAVAALTTSFSIVCVCLLVAVVIVAFCFVRSRARIASQRQKMAKFAELQNVDLVLEEQRIEKEQNMAKLKVNTALFEVKGEDLRLQAVIGQGGGSAVVYKALWQGKVVAFKSFKIRAIASASGAMEEFEREVEMMASINHPNVLGFFGACCTPPRIGYIMEFCPFGDLRHFLLKRQQAGRSCSFSTRVRLLKETASALSYLHAHSIIHRDVKPENILVDEMVHAKLMDFGISRTVDTTMTRQVGTRDYLAPEVFQSSHYNEKADVYSFAILAYVVLTDEFTPYGETSHLIELKVPSDPTFRPQVSVLQEKNVPEWMIQMITKSWDADSSIRPSMEEILRSMREKKVADGCEGEEEEGGEEGGSILAKKGGGAGLIVSLKESLAEKKQKVEVLRTEVSDLQQQSRGVGKVSEMGD